MDIPFGQRAFADMTDDELFEVVSRGLRGEDSSLTNGPAAELELAKRSNRVAETKA